MPDGQLQPRWPEIPPEPKRSPGVQTWAALRRLHAGGWLRPRRIGCLLLVLVLLLFAVFWMASFAINGAFAWLNPAPAPVNGSATPTFTPPPSSGSPTIDRIVNGINGPIPREPLTIYVAIRNKKVPGLAEHIPNSPPNDFDSYRGFDLALLELIATDFGVDRDHIRMKSVPLKIGEQMLTGKHVDAHKGANREADILLGGYEITPERRAAGGVAGPYLTNPSYGFGLSPGDEIFRERVNDVLRKAINDGTWARLYTEYLGTPVPGPPTIE